MPPLIALILCTIFVLFLLYQESKQSLDVSWVIWLPTIWFISIVSKPLGIWFMTAADVDGGSPLDCFFQSSILLIGLILLVQRRTGRESNIKDNMALFILIGYMLISILWTDNQYVSLKRFVRDMPAVVMALIIATEANSTVALESIFRRTIYILIPFSLMLIKYYSYLGVSYGRWSGEVMWIGVTLQKNGLGRLCLFAAFFLIWSMIKRRKCDNSTLTGYQKYIEIFTLLLTFYIMGGPRHSLSYSATSNIVFVVGLLTLLSLYFFKQREISIGKTALTLSVSFIIIYGTVTPFLGGLSIIDPSAIMGREENLTGRTEIWATLIPYAKEHLFLGYGYGGFWTEEIHAKTSSHAHNGYLDVILNIGLFGLLLTCLFLIMCCKQAHKLLKDNFDFGVLFICFIYMTVSYNIAESSINFLANQITATLVFLSIVSNSITKVNEV